MIRSECLHILGADEFFDQPGWSLKQIDQDEAIDHVAEVGIDIEA